MDPEAFAVALRRFPRVQLAMLPTPITMAARLSSTLQGPDIWIKREDLVGLGFGGSKYRMLEFTLGDALARGADVLIASGVAQSNHPQQVVCAAAQLGIPVVVLLGGREGHVGWTGNMLLEGLAGAEIHVLPQAGFAELADAQETLAQKLRADGRNPAIVTLTRHVRLRGVLAYASYIIELIEQLEQQRIEPRALYVGSGGPTYAGMLMGVMALGASFDVVGINPLGSAAEASHNVLGLIDEATRLLEINVPIDPERVRITDAYLGAGHGLATTDAVAAIKLLASSEGLFLDPVYSGKAMAGLIDHVRRGEFVPGDAVVFAHTGGSPSIFAYSEDLMAEPYSVVTTG
jgi:1-aminocyclopropane-1-carboxylate deaminase/D-cysteine desulfhydrase-like pyridoxal-dependent ACC family enzyme